MSLPVEGVNFQAVMGSQGLLLEMDFGEVLSLQLDFVGPLAGWGLYYVDVGVEQLRRQVSGHVPEPGDWASVYSPVQVLVLVELLQMELASQDLDFALH